MVAMVALGACSSDPVLVTPRVFERAQRFALLCLNVSGETPQGAPLDACTLGTGDAQPEGFRLHALVTQSTEGTLAVVDLTRSRILDGDRRIPGFTFVDIGPLPTDVAVSPDGRFAYVARLGDGMISVVDTSRLLSQTSGVEVDGSPVRLAPEGAADEIVARPFAIALDPEGAQLFVSLPETSEVVVLDTSTLAISARIALSSTGGPALEPNPYDRAGADWRRACGEAPPPTPPPPRDAGPTEDAGPGDDDAGPGDGGSSDDAGESDDGGPVDAGPGDDGGPLDAGPAPTPAEPRGLAVDPGEDGEPGIVFVADGALGIIHRIDMESLTELEPTVVGRPTVRLDVSPRLVDGTKWLYAVETLAASIVVVDVSSGPGAVEPIETNDALVAEDRLSFRSPARDVSFLVRNYDASVACDPANVAPLELHGVFAVAALTDGSIRLIDVDDLDRECRATRAQCSSSDTAYRYRRHRPRIGIEVSDPIGLAARPELTSGGRFESSDECEMEDVMSTTVPCLRSVDRNGVTCGGLSGYVASEGVCVLDDPWLVLEETWTVRYEGALPSAVGGRGRFSDGCLDGGTCELDGGGLSFCGAGVTGGMQLLVTRPPPEDIAESRPECAALFDEDAMPPIQPRLRIVRAFDGRVELVAFGENPWEQPATVADCYPELSTFEVRTIGEWTVVGSITGYLHPVIAEGITGECVVDESRSELFTGRARDTDDFYENPRVAFRVVHGERDPRIERYAFSFSVAGVPAQVGVDVGSLPSDIGYSRATDELYVLDESESGLVRLDLDPLRIEATFR